MVTVELPTLDLNRQYDCLRVEVSRDSNRSEMSTAPESFFFLFFVFDAHFSRTNRAF